LDQFAKIKRWFKSSITPSNRDLKIVILCIIGATMIWFLSALNKSYTTVVRCPIQLDYVKEGTIEVIIPPNYVDVNVSGNGWDLLKQSLSFGQNPLILTIENPIDTKQIAGYTIQPHLAQHLSFLNLNFVVTDTITFDIQPLLSKRMDVYIDSAAISLKKAYQIISPISISPDTVKITGPDKLINSLTDSLIVKIPASDIDRNYDGNISIDLYDPRLVNFVPGEINVNFEISMYVDHFAQFDIDLVNFPIDSSSHLINPQIGINFKIREAMARDFPRDDFLIIADFNNISIEDSTIRLELISSPIYVQEVVLDTMIVKIGFTK